MSSTRPIDWSIGVGDPTGHHSQVWKIWAAKKTPDLYIAARSLSGKMKASIHASGARHVGLTSEQYRKEVAEGSWIAPTRHHDQWSEGFLIGEGLTLEYVLRFPLSQLRKYPLTAKETAAIWIPATPPLPNQTLEVGIFIADRPLEVRLDPLAGHTGVAVGYLADGRGVGLITQTHPRGLFPEMAKMANEIALSATSRGINFSNVGPNDRVVIGFHVGHVRGWADYALDTFLPPGGL